LGVLLCERYQVLRQLCFGEDRGGLANRNAGATINTVHRIDKELSGLRKLGLILSGMNAINRTNLDAFLIFRASINNYESHESFSSDEFAKFPTLIGGKLPGKGIRVTISITTG